MCVIYIIMPDLQLTFNMTTDIVCPLHCKQIIYVYLALYRKVNTGDSIGKHFQELDIKKQF